MYFARIRSHLHKKVPRWNIYENNLEQICWIYEYSQGGWEAFLFNQAFHLISFYNENKANPKISLSHHHKARMIHAAVFFFEKEFLLAPVEHLNIFCHDNKFFFSLAARSDFISKIKIFKAPTEDSFVLVFL